MSLIVINPERCTNCMNCARACPVQAISVVLDLDRPEFIHQRCIGCGSCVKTCRDGAITFQNNTWDVKSYLDSGSKVAAIVDPSISAEFPDITDYRKFVEMIRALGFDFVYDASFGVELVAGAYQKLFKAFKGKYFITANCPAIVHFIQKYQPGLIQNLAPIVSPMIASSRAVHSLPGNEMKVVFIGPCIAAKLDLENKDGDSKIDAVITFSELRQLFTECGVHESQLEYSEFDPPSGKVGSLYPISNGILQVAEIDEGQLSGTVITEDGNINVVDNQYTFNNQEVVINKVGPADQDVSYLYLSKALCSPASVASDLITSLAVKGINAYKIDVDLCTKDAPYPLTFDIGCDTPPNKFSWNNKILWTKSGTIKGHEEDVTLQFELYVGKPINSLHRWFFILYNHNEAKFMQDLGIDYFNIRVHLFEDLYMNINKLWVSGSKRQIFEISPSLLDIDGDDRADYYLPEQLKMEVLPFKYNLFWIDEQLGKFSNLDPQSET
nr:4Fe-4S binding protein [Bacteroidota bacterium]